MASDNDESEPPPAIVIDNGSYSVSCGFGGEDTPESNLIAVHAASKCEAENSLKNENYLFVKERDGMRAVPGGFCKYSVIREGVVQDWDCLEALWETFFVEKEVDCTEKSMMMLSAISNNCLASSRKFCEILFEKFGFRRLCISRPETMALLASGRFTGVVTNIGYDHCVSLPISDGLDPITKELFRRSSDDQVEVFPVKVGGRHVSEYIRKELINTHGLQDNPELDEVVEDIKRNHCYVSQCWGSERATSPQLYTLPDNSTISLSDVLRDSTEILFSTRDEESGRNVVDALCGSVLLSALRNGYRSATMWDNMVLCGGTSLIRGFKDRIYTEVYSQSDPGAKFRTIAGTDHFPWIGASIFSSLSGFEDHGLSKMSYEEAGPREMQIL